MKKILLGLGTLALVFGIMGTFTNTAKAYKGDFTVQDPNYSAERHESMEKAFETKDFTAWSNLMQNRGRASQVINKDNFAKFAEAHILQKQGKIIEAREILQELGLKLKDGSGRGMGRCLGL